MKNHQDFRLTSYEMYFQVNNRNYICERGKDGHVEFMMELKIIIYHFFTINFYANCLTQGNN